MIDEDMKEGYCSSKGGTYSSGKCKCDDGKELCVETRDCFLESDDCSNKNTNTFGKDYSKYTGFSTDPISQILGI